MKYRAEVDGLRALAVLPVIFFHAGFEFFSGGFVGVDIFFVISGYLITSILIEDIEKKQFSLLRFYEKRARRILPPLFLMAGISSILVLYVFSPKDVKDFGQSLVATLLFTSNFLFWIESDYFSGASEIKPLLHTWSLSIEEQFYLIYPFILLIFFKLLTRIYLAVLFSSILLISFVANYYYSNLNETSTFFLTHYRIWELAAGVTTAIYMLNDDNSTETKSMKFTPYIGLSLILVAITNPTTESMIIIQLLAVAGTVLILLPSEKSNFVVSHFLKNSALVKIGLYSYSLYLFHQPILAMFKFIYAVEYNNIHALLAISLSFILAILSFYLVETPFRRKIKKNIFYSITAVSFFILLSTGLYMHKYYQKLGNSIYPDYYEIVTKESNEDLTLKRSSYYSVLEKPFDKSLNIKPNLLVVGDSHAFDTALMLHLTKQYKNKFNIRYLDIELSCFDSENEISFKINERIINADLYFINFKRERKRKTLCAQLNNYGNELVGLSNFISKNSNKTIFISKGKPEYDGSQDYTLLDKLALRSKFKNINDFIIFSERYHYLNVEKNEIPESFQLSQKKHSNVVFLSEADLFCSNEYEKCFVVDDKFNKLTFDYGHFSVDGAKFYGNRSVNVWKALMKY